VTSAPSPPSPLGALASALLRAAAAPSEPATTTAAPSSPAPPDSPRAQRRAAAAARYAALQTRRTLGPRATAPSPTPSPPPRRSAPAPRRASLRLNDWQDLANVAQRLRQEQERAAAQAKAEREAAARLQAERQLFSRSVGPITPLRDPTWPLPTEPAPAAAAAALAGRRTGAAESISDDFDVSTLLDTDDQLSFRRPGIGVEITQRLRAGPLEHPAPARPARPAHRRGARGAGRIHPPRPQNGRALRARGARQGPGLARQNPVLKGRVQSWLVQKNEVLAFVQARPAEGGAGALLVLLQPVGHSGPWLWHDALQIQPQPRLEALLRCQRNPVVRTIPLGQRAHTFAPALIGAQVAHVPAVRRGCGPKGERVAEQVFALDMLVEPELSGRWCSPWWRRPAPR
jgi:DNA-nicking Smr family endonuclease